MKEKQVILNRLLDKYEKSKHLLQPGTSNRRVMLQTERKDLPEYNYENAQIRDSFNLAAKELEQQGLIELEWLQGRKVMMVLALRLDPDSIHRAYQLANRLHPRERAEKVCSLVKQALSGIQTPWISRWREELCAQAEQTYRVPAFCRDDFSALKDLLTAMVRFDTIADDGMTKRAFSILCYQDSKYFERFVENEFLRIAVKMDNTLGERCALEPMSPRDQLSYLGIYASPELYEMAGPFVLYTEAGAIDFHSTEPCGLALPGTLAGRITEADFTGVNRITFIENKTNYDEYLLREKREDELVFYHGGFLSPQKCRFVRSLMQFVSPEMDISLWSDIDMGGFLMFEQLQSFIPALRPLRMMPEDVERFHKYGLERKDAYLTRLQETLEQHRFPLFEDTIRSILKYRVTIEQEVFLL